jgi:hypothetical protein
MTPYRLKAKIDRGLALMIYALIVASALPLLFSPGWYFVAIHVLLIILTTDMLYGTHYTINDQYLILKGGVFYTLKIEITSVISIKPSRSIESAPAPSFDRLEITLKPNKKRVLVSPKDKELFIALLLERNPEIIVK